jgi:hypothetical protein
MRDLNDVMVQDDAWSNTVDRVGEDDATILIVTFGDEEEKPDDLRDPGPLS